MHKSWDRHDRISAISAITCSPVQNRLGLHFRLQEANFRWPAVVSFIRELRRHVGRKLAIIWDRLNVHRSARVQLERLYGDEVQFHWLPGYSPELNPVERVWSHTKYSDLANNLPENIVVLWRDIFRSLTAKRRNPKLLGAFFRHAGLALS